MINLILTKELKNKINDKPEEVQKIVDNEQELGICITNSDGKFVHVNQRYLDIYGYTKDEIIGKSFTIVVPEENQEYMKSLHDKFIEDQYEILRQWKVVNKAGETIDIQVDAGWNDKIFDGKAHKITFVHVE